MNRTTGARVFTLLVAAYVLATLVQTVTLSPVARRVPAWVLPPLLLLLGLELVFAFSPRRAARWSSLAEADPFAARDRLARRVPGAESETDREARPAAWSVFAWYALLPLLVCTLDLRLALGLYTFSYARARAGASWVRAAALALGMAGLAAGLLRLLE